jgi:ABC-type amino acid transport substrate-binding protein
MMTMKKILLCLVAAAGLAAGVRAADASFQASLVPDCALRDETDTITFASLNIWGMNPQHALAVGFVNGSYGQSSGLSAGFINYAENYTGVQWGFVNSAYSDFTGWQAACLNYTGDAFHGFQFGFVNYAGRLTGLQLGFFNMAAQADHGLQLGLVNLLPENRQWFSAGLANEVAPVMVFANWRFD